HHAIRYEGPVAGPVTPLTKLCAFLGEEFDEAMLEHHRSAEEKAPDYKDWHEQVHRPVNTAALKRWQRDLDADEVRLFEWVAAEQLEAVGYEPSLSSWRRRPSRSMRRSYEKFLAGRKEREAAEAEAAEQVAREYKHPVAAMLTSRQRELARSQGYGDLLEAAAVSPEQRGT